MRLRKLVSSLLAHHTGLPVEEIERDVERDFILNADQAVSYGLTDRVLEKREVSQEPAVMMTR